MSDHHRFLVTAGKTREMIDRVRDWGNIFTGNTGYAIARALTPLGQVDLLTSNRAHVAQAEADGIHAAPFTSHADLKEALGTLLARQKYDAIFMTAAVADYAPAGVFQVVDRKPAAADGTETWTVRNVQADKVKSTFSNIAVLGQPTEKLVDRFRGEWKHTGLLVKFKLEVGVAPDELIRIGQASRRASGADYLVANTLDMVTGGEGGRAGAYVLSETGYEFVPRPHLAAWLAEITRIHLRQK
jgi:phosphopantothenoylcysteine synthetase/decarboxylase